MTDSMDIILYVVLNVIVFLSIAVVYYLHQSKRIRFIKRMRGRKRSREG